MAADGPSGQAETLDCDLMVGNPLATPGSWVSAQLTDCVARDAWCWPAGATMCTAQWAWRTSSLVREAS